MLEASSSVKLIDEVRNVIVADLPPTIQTFKLLQILDHRFSQSSRKVRQPVTTTSDIVIWLRDTQGRFLAVNQLLQDCTGMPAAAFAGITYDDYCLDRHLIEQRRKTDRQVALYRRPGLFLERSIYGDFETLTIPLLSDCDSLLATVHIASFCLDQPTGQRCFASIDKLSLLVHQPAGC